MEKILTVQEAAVAWNITSRRVSKLCFNGQIPGAQRFGKVWMIPAEAEKPPDGRTLRYNQPTKAGIKPFLKWAGGKGQLLTEIQKYYQFDKYITKYAEPMLGGGAVLFDVLNKYNLQSVYISDANPELISTYMVLKENIDALIMLLQQFQNEYWPLTTEERKVYYGTKRERFNELKQNFLEKADVEKAALMIFLNRTCFNGLYRVNSKGGFNVPMGAYKTPLICDELNLRNIAKRLKHVTVRSGDYHYAADFIDEHTFVYFDPPYRPLSATSGFTAYNEDGFNDDAQRELAEFANEMSKRQALVLISNSDPKNTNENDNFFEELYTGWHIKRVSAHRNINSKANARRTINELLISNF